MLRQEVVADLLGVLNEARENTVRLRLMKLVEGNLKAGVAAAQRAEALWPTVQEVQETVAKLPQLKPALAKRHLTLFNQLDRVQRRSLVLLTDSFANIRVILDRVRPPEEQAT